MARIRTIKPSFFKSDDVSALPLRARLTWIGLWTQCDDQGRAKDHARLIKADIWPLDTDVSLADIEDDLSTLAEHGRIVRYEVAGQRYLEITNWSVHQKIDRRTESRIPPPSAGTPIDSSNGRRTVDEDSPSPRSGKGREGKGREGTRARGAANDHAPTPLSPEPPSKCTEHIDNPNPPNCGPCADARRGHAQWEADRNARIAAAPKCRRHRGELASNCGRCRSEHLAAEESPS